MKALLHTSIREEADLSVWDFDQLAPVLRAVGMAAAKDEPLDLDLLGSEWRMSPLAARTLVDQVDGMGLIFAPRDEPGLPPALTRAGSQYLDLGGEVSDQILHFLPEDIDDLHARGALLHGGSALVDEFRHQLLHGRGVQHARGLVPRAFAPAVDDSLAIDLFAAAVALMARLSGAEAAGCVAEEILSVALIDNASVWLEVEADEGNLAREDLPAALDALRGLFELFEDDDVLAMFQMEEPGDAALAGHSPFNRQAGVADQRIEAWFRPFGSVPETGYLHSARMPPGPSETSAPLVEIEPGEAVGIDEVAERGRFRAIVRVWRGPPGSDEEERIAATWIYYLDADGPGAALEAVRRRFPDGSNSATVLEGMGTIQLDQEDLLRVSIDVQPTGRSQRFSEGGSFHFVGELAELGDAERLGRLAATLAAAFRAAVVMSEGRKAYFAVSMNAENLEEADANVEEVVSAFGEATDLAEDPVIGSALGHGSREPAELIAEIESYRRDW